ncbi:MAG: DinB family protein [Bacteriovoracaceae bacterium]
MSLEKYYRQCETIASLWIEDINRYTDEQFLRKPDDRQWSIGQVYEHLIQSAMSFHLEQIRLCTDKRGVEMQGGKKPPGRIIYFFGNIPPMRIQVPPSPTYTPKQPSGKNEIADRLRGVLRVMKEIQPAVESASQSQKTEHPAFGYLNAREWFQLIPMHYRHHRRQQSRLNKFLGVK